MIIGFHLHKKDSFIKSYEDIYDVSILQIFVTGPMNSKQIISDEEIEYLANVPEDIIIHGSYLDVIGGKRSKFTEIQVKKELEIAERLNAIGLIVHIPKAPIDIVKEFVRKFDDYKIYLEISRFKEQPDLKELFKDISAGLCIDTAHLWSAGVDISSYEAAMEYIDNLPYVPMILHLNDQKWNFGSQSDQHVKLLHGTIWSDYNANGFKNIVNSGLFAFIKYFQEHDYPIIFERKNEQDVPHDLEIVNKLI